MWVRSNPVKPCFTLMYSMTCKHVYWYEYQFCTSRAKTTVRSQFTIEGRQQITIMGTVSVCQNQILKFLSLQGLISRLVKVRHAECVPGQF